MTEPQPPQPEQQPAMPGTTDALDPRPDHGKGSYAGHGRLRGTKTVITGRAAQPRELAPTYVLLASDEASYIIGATIPVTGGRPFI